MPGVPALMAAVFLIGASAQRLDLDLSASSKADKQDKPKKKNSFKQLLKQQLRNRGGPFGNNNGNRRGGSRMGCDLSDMDPMMILLGVDLTELCGGGGYGGGYGGGRARGGYDYYDDDYYDAYEYEARRARRDNGFFRQKRNRNRNNQGGNQFLRNRNGNNDDYNQYYNSGAGTEYYDPDAPQYSTRQAGAQQGPGSNERRRGGRGAQNRNADGEVDYSQYYNAGGVSGAKARASSSSPISASSSQNFAPDVAPAAYRSTAASNPARNPRRSSTRRGGQTSGNQAVRTYGGAKALSQESSITKESVRRAP